MNGKPFFDTNLLIYTIAKADARGERARTLLAGGGIFSVQVLNEFVAIARRKLRMPWSEVREALADFRSFCPVPTVLSPKTHELGLDIAERYGYRIYDALIVSAALEASCKILYSEDMQNGQSIEGLTISNPF